MEDDILSLSKTEAVRRLQKAVRITQGVSRASYASQAKPTWWEEHKDVILPDGSVAQTGLFVSASQGRWTINQVKAALVLFSKWQAENAGSGKTQPSEVKVSKNEPAKIEIKKNVQQKTKKEHDSDDDQKNTGTQVTFEEDLNNDHNQSIHLKKITNIDEVRSSRLRRDDLIEKPSRNIESQHQITNTSVEKNDEVPTHKTSPLPSLEDNEAEENNDYNVENDKENVSNDDKNRVEGSVSNVHQISSVPTFRNESFQGDKNGSQEKSKTLSETANIQQIEQEIRNMVKRKKDEIEQARARRIGELEKEIAMRKRTLQKRAENQVYAIRETYRRHKLKYPSKILKMKICDFAELHAGDPEAVLMEDVARGVRQEMDDTEWKGIHEELGPAKTPKAGRRRERAEQIAWEEVQRFRPTRGAAIESRLRTREIVGPTPRVKGGFMKQGGISIDDLRTKQAVVDLSQTVRKEANPLKMIRQLRRQLDELEKEYEQE